MKFNDALSILLGWVGQDLEVSIAGASGAAPELAAELHGRLRSGDELASGDAPANSLLFGLVSEDGEELSSFILAKDAFRGAGWLDAQQQVLRINCGTVTFLVGPRIS